MQEKYKKLYQHFIGKMMEKLASRGEAEEILAEMGLPVILQATRKILDEVEERAGSHQAKEVENLLSAGKEIEAFTIVSDLGIDTDKIMKDSFINIFAEVLHSVK